MRKLSISYVLTQKTSFTNIGMKLFELVNLPIHFGFPSHKSRLNPIFTFERKTEKLPTTNIYSLWRFEGALKLFSLNDDSFFPSLLFKGMWNPLSIVFLCFFWVCVRKIDQCIRDWGENILELFLLCRYIL